MDKYRIAVTVTKNGETATRNRVVMLPVIADFSPGSIAHQMISSGVDTAINSPHPPTIVEQAGGVIAILPLGFQNG